MQTNDLNFNCAQFVEYYHFFCEYKIVCVNRTLKTVMTFGVQMPHCHRKPFLSRLESFTTTHTHTSFELVGYFMFWNENFCVVLIFPSAHLNLLIFGLCIPTHTERNMFGIVCFIYSTSIATQTLWCSHLIIRYPPFYLQSYLKSKVK